MKTTDYRLFGRTGVQFSPLVLGAMAFGRQADRELSFRIIDRALDAGIHVIDTANGYGGGVSEEIVGEALERDARRARVFLCTKVAWKVGDPPNQQGTSRYHIIRQCEASLRRLRTDHIDLYQIHRPHPEVAIDETLRALDDLVRSGKVRYIGSSTFPGWQVVAALWASKELGLNRFVSEQPPYNLLDRRIERELLPVARSFGLGVIPWSPVAGGLLSGRIQRGQPVPKDARYATRSPERPNRLVEPIFDVIEPLEELARAKEVTLAELALAWVVQQPGVTAPIVGPRTLEHLESNLRALEISFTPQELRRIDATIPPGTHVSPFYDADFGPYQHTW